MKAPPAPPPPPQPARQPWIANPRIETVFILLPPFLSLAFIAAFPALFQDKADIPDAWWVILILLVDVAHVYSTLYRTYFDRQSFSKFRQPLTLIPLIGLIAGVALYWQSPHVFWRVLAYLAVWHFIRQQYGFMRIYSRSESAPRWARQIDTFTIYYAALYPLIDWHLGGPRNFNWFVDDDFVFVQARALLRIATALYWLTLAVWLAREIIQVIRTRYLNIPRFTILAGTILSWYFGIVYYNGDMAFTLLNVVSHGIPYMALIWLYGKRQQPTGVLLRNVFSRYGIILFLGIIFLLAYFEEGLWDMTVWKEHVNLFAIFHLFGHRLHGGWLTLVVPLLALPQVTHYVIDGFIWRRPKAA
jgi:hypothetical protein